LSYAVPANVVGPPMLPVPWARMLVEYFGGGQRRAINGDNVGRRG